MERPADTDLDRIMRVMRKHGNTHLPTLIAEGRLVLLLDTAGRLHFVPRELEAFLQATPLPPDAFGEPWGRLEDGRWTPSLAAIVRIGAASRSARVIIKDAAAQHFLYHKGVHKEGVLERDPELRPGDECWVTDPRGNVLGRAKLAAPDLRNPDVLRPIDDLGWYLREGG